MASRQDIRYTAGEVTGQAQVKKDEVMNSVHNAAQTTRDKASGAADSTKESTESGKEQASGMLQQTGEQIKSMAQGAADALKNTLGMGDNNPPSKH